MKINLVFLLYVVNTGKIYSEWLLIMFSKLNTGSGSFIRLHRGADQLLFESEEEIGPGPVVQDQPEQPPPPAFPPGVLPAEAAPGLNGTPAAPVVGQDGLVDGFGGGIARRVPEALGGRHAATLPSSGRSPVHSGDGFMFSRLAVK
jgi:hypothetical protein